MAGESRQVAITESEKYARTLREFLGVNPASVVVEANEVLFSLSTASYELTAEARGTLLHLWSAERSVVRRVVGVKQKGSGLELQVCRLGQKTPTLMLLLPECMRAMPPDRERTRMVYVELLTRVLQKEFSSFRVESARATMDLQHSFGPAYTRGIQVQGQTAWAFIGAGGGEATAALEGILAVGILWMAHLRERTAGDRVVAGLRIILPREHVALTQARLAWMDRRVASYEVYALHEGSGELQRFDPHDCGNVKTRLLRAPEEKSALEADGRFGTALSSVLSLLPERPKVGWSWGATLRGQLAEAGVETRLRSGAELIFLRHGLEFCRIRLGFKEDSFNRAPEVYVGGVAEQVTLRPGNEAEMRSKVHELFTRRSAAAGRRRLAQSESGAGENDVLYRTQPERWLESRLRADITVLDEFLRAEPVYVQTGAVAGARDRGMIDLLAHTRGGRLAVIEVKAEEDLHLPLQGLDYWIRIREHQRANIDTSTGLGDLQQQGYFGCLRLSAESPLLFLVAPSLHLHSSTEVILRHLHSEVEWRVVALDERWRTQLKAVWTRRSGPRYFAGLLPETQVRGNVASRIG